MRNIINISLPVALAAEVEKEVKKGGFASKSEFFRHVLRERRLAKELEDDRREFEKGKGKVLKSLRDLR
jgi:Arc/MetJ-type ribon-helix-helix transcriptional regulator